MFYFVIQRLDIKINIPILGEYRLSLYFWYVLFKKKKKIVVVSNQTTSQKLL